MMRTKIYTKVGDRGQTALLGGAKTAKSDPRLSAYGSLDELNAALGLALAEVSPIFQLRSVATALERNQHLLFVAGSHLACVDEKMRTDLPPLPTDAVTSLEGAIDELETHVPELKSFILPGGSRAAATLHLTRTICRRAEREVVSFVEPLKKPPEIFFEIISFNNIMLIFCH